MVVKLPYFRNSVIEIWLRLVVILLGIGAGLWGGDVQAEELDSQSTTPSGKYLAADYAYHQHQMSLALNLYQEALAADPKNPELLRKSYITALAAGQINQAIQFAHRLKSLETKHSFADVLLALNAFDQQQYDKAQQMVRELIDDKDQQAMLGISQVLLPYLDIWLDIGQKDYHQAQQKLEKILGGHNDGAPFLYFQMALIYDYSGEYDKAAEYYERALSGDYVPYAYIKGAANFFERSGALKKAEAIYEKHQGSYPHLAYFEQDLVRVKRGEKNDKRFIASIREGVAEVLAEAGRVLYGAKLYEDALIYLQLTLHFAPQHHDSIILLATFYEQQGIPEKAIALYQSIDKHQDLYWASRIYQAENWYEQGKKQEALDLLDLLMKYPSLQYAALLTRGNLFRKDERFSDAVYTYSELLRLIGNNGIKKEHWSIFFSRGTSYERLGRWKEAEQDLKKALQLNPKQPDVLNYLGYSWIDKGEHIEEAKKMVDLAVTLQQDNGQVVDSMGWALYKLKAYEEGVGYLERAVELLPEDPVVNDHLGDIYWRLGRKYEAKYQWEKALRFNENGLIERKLLQQKLLHGLKE